MTSKNSFFNWMKEDRKRRIWTIVLFLCICFVFTIAFEMVIENTLTRFQNHTIGQQELMETIETLTGRNCIPFYLLLSGIGAMLYGFQAFAWLMSKQKVDFYHSLPITRKEGFMVRYLNGILFFIIPFLLHTGLLFLLIGARGLLTKEITRIMLSNLALYFLAFLLMYHLVILAVMLTGNLIVAMLAAATFLLYPSVLRLILSWYYHESFMTESYLSDPFVWIRHFAPLEHIVSMFRGMTENNISRVQAINTVLFMIGITFCLCLWLYQKRPSESAGKALAFKRTGNVIRIFIAIPCAMVSGFFFFALTGSNSTIWLYLGTMIGTVFIHGFMEVIFHFDIRAAFRKKLQLVGTLAVVSGIVSVFHFDLTGFDSYLPKQSDLKAIAYDVDFDVNTRFYYQMDRPGEMGGLHIDPTERMKASRTENTEDMYRLLEAYTKQIKKEQDESEYKEFLVCYELTNGKKVYRNYLIGRTLLEKYFDVVYESKEAKRNLYAPVLDLPENGIKNIECYTPFEESKPELTEPEIRELLSRYKKDLEDETFAQYLDRRTLARLVVFYNEKGKNKLQYVELPVQDTYKNTEEYLKLKGISITLPNEKYEIKEAKISGQMDSRDEIGAIDQDVVWQETEKPFILTKEQTKEILPFLTGSEYLSNDSLNHDKEQCLLVLTVKNKKTEVESELDYYLDRERIPKSLSY